MSKCDAMQFSDQMSCACGNVWDMNDPDPPECRKIPDMTTNKPEVVGLEVSAHGSSPLIRLSDYETLQAECEKLRCIISDLKDWDCDVSAGFLSIPVYLRRRMQEAIDAARQEPNHD